MFVLCRLVLGVVNAVSRGQGVSVAAKISNISCFQSISIDISKVGRSSRECWPTLVNKWGVCFRYPPRPWLRILHPIAINTGNLIKSLQPLLAIAWLLLQHPALPDWCLRPSSQGPVAKVTLKELKLGKQRCAGTVNTAAALSLPISLVGLAIHLRGEEHWKRVRKQSQPSLTGPLLQWLSSIGLQLLFWAIPHLCVAVQDVQVLQKVSVCYACGAQCKFNGHSPPHACCTYEVIKLLRCAPTWHRY